MSEADFDLNDPEFLARAAEVRRDVEAGVTMSLGEIADRLGMPFELFARFMAAEMFRQDPNVVAVEVCEFVEETLQ